MRNPDYNTLVPYAFVAMQCPACGQAGLTVQSRHNGLVCEACAQTFPGLATVPDLAPGLGESLSRLRWLARWSRTARWVRRRGRPTIDRWTSGRTADDRDAWVVSWLRPVDGPVLDLCTGAGHTAGAVARWMGAGRVIGVDASLTLLRQTQSSPLDPGLAYVRAADERLPFQDGSVGAVQAMAGLHQTPSPLGLVAEVGRVLAPGGTFVGAVHVDEGPSGLRWLVRALGEPPVERSALVDAIDAAGMAMVSLQLAGITAFFAARRR